MGEYSVYFFFEHSNKSLRYRSFRLAVRVIVVNIVTFVKTLHRSVQEFFDLIGLQISYNFNCLVNF